MRGDLEQYGDAIIGLMRGDDTPDVEAVARELAELLVMWRQRLIKG